MRSISNRLVPSTQDIAAQRPVKGFSASRRVRFDDTVTRHVQTQYLQHGTHERRRCQPCHDAYVGAVNEEKIPRNDCEFRDRVQGFYLIQDGAGQPQPICVPFPQFVLDALDGKRRLESHELADRAIQNLTQCAHIAKPGKKAVIRHELRECDTRDACLHCPRACHRTGESGPRTSETVSIGDVRSLALLRQPGLPISSSCMLSRAAARPPRTSKVARLPYGFAARGLQRFVGTQTVEFLVARQPVPQNRRIRLQQAVVAIRQFGSAHTTPVGRRPHHDSRGRPNALPAPAPELGCVWGPIRLSATSAATRISGSALSSSLIRDGTAAFASSPISPSASAAAVLPESSSLINCATREFNIGRTLAPHTRAHQGADRRLLHSGIAV